MSDELRRQKEKLAVARFTQGLENLEGSLQGKVMLEGMRRWRRVIIVTQYLMEGQAWIYLLTGAGWMKSVQPKRLYPIPGDGDTSPKPFAVERREVAQALAKEQDLDIEDLHDRMWIQYMGIRNTMRDPRPRQTTLRLVKG